MLLIITSTRLEILETELVLDSSVEEVVSKEDEMTKSKQTTSTAVGDFDVIGPEVVIETEIQPGSVADAGASTRRVEETSRAFITIPAITQRHQPRQEEARREEKLILRQLRYQKQVLRFRL